MGKRDGSIKLMVGKTAMKLRFSTNAMVLFEEIHGQPFTKVSEFFERAVRGDISFKAMRALLYAGLSDDHDISLKDAGALIDQLGFADAMEKVAEAIKLAFPDSADDVGNDGKVGVKTKAE